MRILIVGANGFLGSSIAERLQDAGHQLVLAAREPGSLKQRWPDIPTISVNFSEPRLTVDWLPLLQGVDVVVNAVGILHEQPGQSFHHIHFEGPIALYRACATTGVSLIIHISALGADHDAKSRYHLSKRQLDDALMSLPIASTILQPSLVFGVEGASTSIFLMLALLPLILIPGGGNQLIQPVHRDDVCAAVLKCVEVRQGIGRVPVVGSQCITFAHYLDILRRSMGFSRAYVLPLPSMCIRWLQKLGIGGFLDSETIAMLNRGNCADSEKLTSLLGRPVREVSTFLTTEAKVARERTVLRAILPLLRISLALMWIITGIVSALVYPQSESLALLAQTGLHGNAALTALYGAAVLDVLLGLALLVKFTRGWAYLLQFSLMTAYTLIITIFLPEYWSHPFGPILKNFPLLVMTLFLWMLESRHGLYRR